MGNNGSYVMWTLPLYSGNIKKDIATGSPVRNGAHVDCGGFAQQ